MTDATPPQETAPTLSLESAQQQLDQLFLPMQKQLATFIEANPAFSLTFQPPKLEQAPTGPALTLRALLADSTVYVAGPVTGNPVYKQTFDFWKTVLHKAAPDARLLIPAELPDYLTYTEAMVHRIQLLSRAQFILQMPGWRRSAGARAKTLFARACQIKEVTVSLLDLIELVGGGTCRHTIRFATDEAPDVRRVLTSWKEQDIDTMHGIMMRHPRHGEQLAAQMGRTPTALWPSTWPAVQGFESDEFGVVLWMEDCNVPSQEEADVIVLDEPSALAVRLLEHNTPA